MSFERWNDKVLRTEDGWGYRISEGDVLEVVIQYQEDGKPDKEEMRICGTEYMRAIGEMLIEKADEMDRNG